MAKHITGKFEQFFIFFTLFQRNKIDEIAAHTRDFSHELAAKKLEI